jgi:hypothetical protein
MLRDNGRTVPGFFTRSCVLPLSLRPTATHQTHTYAHTSPDHLVHPSQVPKRCRGRPHPASSKCCTRVVLPDPRNPVTTTAGTAAGRGARGRESMRCAICECWMRLRSDAAECAAAMRAWPGQWFGCWSNLKCVLTWLNKLHAVLAGRALILGARPVPGAVVTPGRPHLVRLRTPTAAAAGAAHI